jgi:hypothetical protein
MVKPQKNLAEYKIGDIVEFSSKYMGNNNPDVLGVIIGYHHPYYTVRWFDDRAANGGYLWQTLKKI